MNKYTFTAEKDQDKIPLGSSLIRWVFDDIAAGDYREQTVLFYGRLRTLFGEPLYETENMEEQYAYCVSAQGEDGKTIYLEIHSGGSGPVIGGLRDEESRKAADALFEFIMQAKPADYEYTGYYLGDSLYQEHWIVKDEIPYAEETELHLPEEEMTKLVNRLFGL